ncbi:MAG: hypothetical protein BRD55_09090 [Bacteroidetes bacterium SW_9_63_38]|nr:MAG: hypothetical protein BRD55_09090 [Bacteroidetes bacterium SW_9_63_38]
MWPGEVESPVATDLRSGTGHPGPSHWQNNVQYTVNATLDTTAQELRGEVTVQYTNNSPFPISSLWFLTGADSDITTSSAPKRHIQVETVTAAPESDAYTPTALQTRSRLQVRLQEPVAARGGTTAVHLEYQLPLSKNDVPGWDASGKRSSVRHRTLVSPRSGV